MMILKPYVDADYPSVSQYFPKKEVDKYTNKGKYRLLSLLGIYKSQFMLLLQDNNEVIGCGVIRWKWSRELHKFGCWLYAIWISPAHRGNGASKVLMNLLLDEIRSKGEQKVYLTVAKDNIVAQNLYNKIGFVKIGENKIDNIMRYDL